MHTTSKKRQKNLRFQKGHKGLFLRPALDSEISDHLNRLPEIFVFAVLLGSCGSELGRPDREEKQNKARELGCGMHLKCPVRPVPL